MIFLLANAAFLILSIGYGWLAGDRLDKAAVLWIVAALLGTLAATSMLAGTNSIVAVLAVDIVLLVAITRIAMISPRFWPTWFAGFHLAGVTCGIAALVAGPLASDTLRAFAGFWGTAALLAMVLGLFADRRANALA